MTITIKWYGTEFIIKFSTSKKAFLSSGLVLLILLSQNILYDHIRKVTASSAAKLKHFVREATVPAEKSEKQGLFQDFSNEEVEKRIDNIYQHQLQKK
mgnify:FL=1